MTVAAALIAALTTPVGQAADKGTLLIWINGDKGYEGIVKAGQKFTKDTGIPVKVEHPDNAVTKFEEAASAGKGPDIWIWAQDRSGSWASAGLIAPVTPSKKTVDDIDPLAWKAWNFSSKTWGYPLSIEAVALIYNKDLVPVPPKTWDEVIAIDKKLAAQNKHAILFPFTAPYYSYGLISTDGYAFKRKADGTYDAGDVGINSPGAVKGVDTLVELIKVGALPKTATYDDADKAMNEGRVAMMLNGPWSWPNLKKNKINFGIAPYPKVDGKQGGSFVGVLGAMIGTASPNKEQANQFIENYLLSVEGLKAINAHVPLGVPANKALFAEMKSDPLIAGTMAAARAGTPMPNNPEMTRFWKEMVVSLTNITQGRELAKDGLDKAAQRIQSR